MIIQDVVNWARTHVRLAPIVNVGGFINQPALDIAHDIKLHIMSQQYNWTWNRASTNYVTVENTHDKTLASLSITNFGWLERAYIEDEASTATPKPKFPLEVVGQLQIPMFKTTPSQVAYEVNSSGQAVFRLDTFPTNVIYRIYIDYQKLVTAPANLNSDWSPIPDSMNDIIRQLFLAYAIRLRNDQQYLIELARADVMLKDRMGTQDQPNDINIGMVPERPIMLG